MSAGHLCTSAFLGAGQGGGVNEVNTPENLRLQQVRAAAGIWRVTPPPEEGAGEELLRRTELGERRSSMGMGTRSVALQPLQKASVAG